MSDYAPPYAKAQVSLNGGSNLQGAQVVTAGETVQFSGVNTTGWDSAEWTLYGFPPGYGAPSGWITNADGTISYSGTQASPNPPIFTLPAITAWGKWGLSLVVNQGLDPAGVIDLERMSDTTMALSMASSLGLLDTMPFEGSHFGGKLREWVGDVQHNWRTIESIIVSGGVGYQTISWDSVPLTQRTALDFEGGGGTVVTGSDVGGVTTITYSSADVYNVATTGIYGYAQNGQTLLNAVGGTGQIISTFLLDTSGGTCVFDMSPTNIPGLQDGYIYILTDALGSAGSWGASPPTITNTDSTPITDPGFPCVTSPSVTMPASNGASVALMYDGVSSVWRMLWCASLGSWRTGTPLTGPSQTGSASLSLAPPGASATYLVTVTMRVTSIVGTPTEAVGDTWSTTAELSWKNVSGTQTLVPVLVGLSSVRGDASMATGASASQTNGGISFVTPSTLDASTTVSVAVTYTHQGNSAS